MDLSSYRHNETITIDRPPSDIYAIVSDVTRIGELSPVCKSGSWDEASEAGSTGAWFTGHNAIGDFSWDTRCKVVAADPDREFTFINFGTGGEQELVRWGFTLEGTEHGTEVVESWEVLPAYPDFVLAENPNADVKARIDGMAQMARDGMADTLANLKGIAES
jgi:Polyketide cyclase / dehydrase and lipid transport